VRAVNNFVALEVNVGRKGVVISLGRESPTSAFVSRADSLMAIHETVDLGASPDPGLARSNLKGIDQAVGERKLHITEVVQLVRLEERAQMDLFYLYLLSFSSVVLPRVVHRTTYSVAFLVKKRDRMSLDEPREAKFHDRARRKTVLDHGIGRELD